MSKYRVNVGGFVSVFRERDIIVYANNEAEAAEKAELKFIALQQKRPGNMCDAGTINSIEKISKECEE
jgi:hypothetical protein